MSASVQPTIATKPSAVLLLPGRLEGFILGELAQDLLTVPGVVAVEAGRIPFGLYGRLPEAAAKRLAKQQANKLALPSNLTVVVIFHPLQLPLAEAVLAKNPGAELWYSRWDRYERALDANDRLRGRLQQLHLQASELSKLTFAVSEELVRLQGKQGGSVELVPLSADGFPSELATDERIVATSFGHLGRRTDWQLLNELATALPQLTLMMIGERHDGECTEDPAFAACLQHSNILFLGRQSDSQAARLIELADVGIVPFKQNEFNDAGLPYRILKYARLGRHTISPPLAGTQTWARAVTTAADINQWRDALTAQAGRRTNPDLELREWALKQTASAQNQPLHQRLAALGFTTDPPGS